MTDMYDIVVVGAGAAGSVVATRLSERTDTSVLLLEAGRACVTDAVTDPSRWNEVLLTDLDWAYLSEPQPGMNGTRVYSASGRGLGGTSNIYHMIHTRGRPADYDSWACGGVEDWSYRDVLPYLRRLENQRDDTNPTGGRDGPITVINARDMGNPISATFIDACVELGYPKVDDFNAADTGVGWHHVDIAGGQRCGVWAGYLDSARTRGNLTIEIGALATELLFAGDQCTGVRYRADGRTRTAYARHEVVVCAGAIQSPKLLMLSGIGDPEHLSEIGIPTREALPGVGRNFQDHPLVIGPIGHLDKPGPDPLGNVTEVALFCSSREGLLPPDLEISLVHRAPFGERFFANVIKRVQSGQPVAPATDLVDPHVILSLSGLARPYSRGWVRLADDNPEAYPRISPNYYGERSDLDRAVTMVEIARDIYRSNSFADAWGLTEIAPGPDVSTRTELTQWVLANTGSYYHFAGSCKMGVDNYAVVDSRLRVHGVRGLRVADASVMPTLVSANPHTTVVMIAERAAAFIREELSL